jgi:arsenate reductase (thioredoxin)
MNLRILVLCTGNSCRSQMAEGILKNKFPEWDMFSAGTKPEKQVNIFAVKVMNEIGIDISEHYPKSIDLFTSQSFDLVITVCDNAKEVCPVFTGKVGRRIHIGFKDPADAKGTNEEILSVYRKVRDQIRKEFSDIFGSEI